MQQIKLITGEYDWMATRLSSRKFRPPSIKKEIMGDKPLTAYDLNPKPYTVTTILGVEGMGVEIGKYRGQRCLLLRLAHATPFVDTLLIYCRQNLAVWNDVFNVWDIPILSQNKSNALREIWGKIEEIYFEIPWTDIELHWRYSISDQNLSALKGRIYQLNNFWASGVIDYAPIEVSLVYQGFTQQQLEKEAIASFHKHLPQAKWSPENAEQEALNRLCVNYLRHKCSAYHVLLKSELSYSRVFRDISLAIASCYPWLKNEAVRQLKSKQV